MARGVCRSCHASIEWAYTVNGKLIPLDAEPVTEGNLQAVGHLHGHLLVESNPTGNRRSHFATCLQAKDWRRPTRASPG
jgi:hypothetical protein